MLLFYFSGTYSDAGYHVVLVLEMNRKKACLVQSDNVSLLLTVASCENGASLMVASHED